MQDMRSPKRKPRSANPATCRRALRRPTKNAGRGFLLVEMLFYVAILTFALVAVTDTLIGVIRSHAALRATQRIEGAVLALERVLRESRGARIIDTAGSTLGAHPGKLLLGAAASGGSNKTVEFSLESGRLLLKENGVLAGALTSPKTKVTNLVFRRIEAGRSEGVKIELAIESGEGTAKRSKRFYGTAALRDSY